MINCYVIILRSPGDKSQFYVKQPVLLFSDSLQCYYCNQVYWILWPCFTYGIAISIFNDTRQFLQKPVELIIYIDLRFINKKQTVICLYFLLEKSPSCLRRQFDNY